MNTNEAAERPTVTAADWDKIHRDFKTGSPRKGTAKILKMTDKGTCLIPVNVVWTPRSVG